MNHNRTPAELIAIVRKVLDEASDGFLGQPPAMKAIDDLAEELIELLDEKPAAAEAKCAEQEKLLWDARDYILNKAQRHDLNWRDGHAIIERMDF